MKYNFLNIFLDKEDLFNQEKFSIDKFLLENNYSQIEKIYNFYKETSNLLYVSGFLGTGKTQVINYTASFLSAETVLLSYFCSSSTILDDILLSFFAEFRRLADKKLIVEPKVKTENFAEKINVYFSQIERPFVIILDSFDSILSENRQEILDFIMHLCKLNKVKAVIISKTFEQEYFNNPSVRLEKVALSAFSQGIFEKYLKSEGIKLPPKILEEFYKQTRGYMFFTSLVINLIKSKNLEPIQFLREFSESFLTLDEFLSRQTLGFISSEAKNLFWFLSMLRHPVNIELLKILDVYDEQKMKNLKDNFILVKNNSSVYIHEFFKDRFDIEPPANIVQKMHQYIVDIYKTQLPLKPFERNILISRQTMRKEIKYHEFFLPKKINTLEDKNIDIGYLSYAKGLEFDLGHPTSASSQSVVSAPFSETKKEVEVKTFNPEAKDKTRIVSQIFPHEKLQKAEEVKKISISDLIKNIKDAKRAYNYGLVIDFCKELLLREDTLENKKDLPFIYTELAFAYQKMADIENALKYFNLAQEKFLQQGKTTEANEIKLTISNIFIENYKTEQAKFILEDILKCEEITDILRIKALMHLAVVEDNLSNTQKTFEYYKQAVKISKDVIDNNVLMELYFRFAAFLDDNNETQLAQEYYLKCINLDLESDNNFVALANSNLADLYLEQENSKSAREHYFRAFEIYNKNGNYDGLYHSSSKLAVILSIRSPQETLKYLEAAFESASFLNDKFYMASAQLALGDFFYDSLNDEMAIKNYLGALKIIEKESDKENSDKIQLRLKDVKLRIGEEKFIELINRFGNE
ncbi:MAG TPA: hypothetical protein PLG15_02355 [Candidatus Gastranaerophilaceae bacterium]|nr:hypothetical protein [Candidatus Gastranaerophilaceae bacterium]HPT41205.1 hypothetical protein [Candidatus Gastranaerophilaceae bacterium]